MKVLTIQPVSRIEGSAKVVIKLDEQGNVADAKFHVLELRGFERFCISRPIEELPRIVPRICGVCPWAHHLASAKAADAVFGIKIPEPAAKIRELAYMFHYLHSHILHFFLLAGPDLVLGPDADYRIRNVVGLLQQIPDEARQVVKIRYLAQMATQIMAGKAIHPDAAVPGGWSKPITPQEQHQLQSIANQCLEFAKFALDYAKRKIFPRYEDLFRKFAVLKTGYMGLVKDGALNFYDGNIRLISSEGEKLEFSPQNYLDYIAEHVEPWSYMKFPYYRKLGFSLNPAEPKGIYRVAPLARLNVCDRIDTPLAQAELEEFRSKFGHPAHNTLAYHWARMIELLYAAENAVRLAFDKDISSQEIRLKLQPRAGRGVGVVEAPRGTLYHDYEVDGNGMVTDVNLLVATVSNNAAINMSILLVAKDLIKQGRYDQGILNQVEMAIRCYDPCLSCATHALGRMPIKLEIRDHHDRLIQVLS